MTLATAKSVLPDAISAGLVGFPEPLARTAETALRRAAGPALADPAFWGSSGLTGDGFPFELSFTTADNDLRWTFDVSAHLPEDQRLAAALVALRRLDAAPPPDRLAALRPHLEEGAFGAWIGARHGRRGDRYKLYFDWQDGPVAQATLHRLGLPRPAFLPKLTVPMVALGPGPDQYEVYYRAEPPPEALVNILAPAGLAHLAGSLEALIEASWGHRLRGRLPGGRVGVSYALAAPGARPQVTIFFFARSLWGGDKRVRARMRAKLAEAGRDGRAYAAATRPLEVRNTAETRHGLVALGIGETWVSWGIGLRPVTVP